ncbi:seryl-tRNA synthetase [Paxillus ammoniavirescens]|nr:seryl-tRNA synthetase [Paxillus ammoniavirescens]
MTTVQHLVARSCRRDQFNSVFYSAARSKRFFSKNVSNALHSATVLPKPRLDYRAISESIVFKSHNAFNRKFPLPVGALQSIVRSYAEQKEMSGQLDAKRHARSILGDRIRTIKDPAEKQVVLTEAKILKAEITQLEEKLAAIEEALLGLALHLPNDTHPDVPIGPENAATILSTHGPPPIPPGTDRDHVTLGRALRLFDFEAGALVTGSSWYYLRGDAAFLENALTNYAISVALKHGFEFIMTPDVVRADIALRCGFQPRDHNSDNPVSQMYHIAGSHPELVLSGTAEIPLGGMFANRIFVENTLPAKVVGLGRSFRAEAGARGADTRGLYRVHQFSKVELFVVCEEDASAHFLEEIRQVQTEIFEGLGIPFRVLDMPTEELGASAYRKYDMEAWMPGRGTWGEISSTSNCTDYQARRLHIRYRRPAPPLTTHCDSPSSHTQVTVPFAHTLNGTAAAIPRLIIALLENGVRFSDNGKPSGIDLPMILKPFWLGSSDLVRWV